MEWPNDPAMALLIKKEKAMTEYESWYKRQVDMGYLPDKDGYYHWPPKEFYEVNTDEFGDKIFRR